MGTHPIYRMHNMPEDSCMYVEYMHVCNVLRWYNILANHASCAFLLAVHLHFIKLMVQLPFIYFIDFVSTSAI